MVLIAVVMSVLIVAPITTLGSFLCQSAICVAICICSLWAQEPAGAVLSMIVLLASAERFDVHVRRSADERRE